MSAFAVEEVCRPSSGMSCDGYWSGTDGRHHEQFIALIPETRYLDLYEIFDRLIKQYFRAPRQYDPQKYQRDRDARELTPKELEKKELYAERRWEAKELAKEHDYSVPPHMSGWPRDQIAAWINADGHKDLQEAIIMLHEQGC